MKTKRMIASLMAFLLAICFQVTAWASTSTWPPKAEEVFRNSGLMIYDSTSTAVATSIEIVSHPQTLSFSGIPQFFSSDGKKLGDMDYAARMKLEEEYKANNNNSVDGFALWLVNMFNDYRGVGKITQQAMDDYWGKKQADAAAKTAEWEAKQRSDLNSLTYQDVFAGINIVVTDKGKQAVRVAGYEFPIKTMYFLDANENKLGYMSGDAYLAMIEKCGETYGKVLNSMPGGSDGFYAQMFNDYRGVKRLKVDEYLDIVRVNRSAISAEGLAILEQVYLKSNGSSTSGNSSSSGNSPTVIDASGWPSDIVRLTNKERGKEGLDALYEDSQLHSPFALRSTPPRIPVRIRLLRMEFRSSIHRYASFSSSVWIFTSSSMLTTRFGGGGGALFCRCPVAAGAVRLAAGLGESGAGAAADLARLFAGLAASGFTGAASGSSCVSSGCKVGMTREGSSAGSGPSSKPPPSCIPPSSSGPSEPPSSCPGGGKAGMTREGSSAESGSSSKPPPSCMLS